MSIVLNRTNENVIAVTATEKATVDAFFFLFVFFLVQDNKDYAVQLTRTNPTSQRYDRFLFNPSTLNMPQGKYHYYIYQSLDDGNLGPEGLKELENGKVTVTDDMPGSSTNFDTNNEQDRSFDFS